MNRIHLALAMIGAAIIGASAAAQTFPELEFRIWMGLMAPAGTPERVLKTIEAAIAEAMRDPALRGSLTGQGWDIVGSGSREFAAFVDTELPKLTAAAKAAGVKAD